MSFVDGPAEEVAGAAAAELFAGDRAQLGYVTNYTRVFALRPEVYQAWAKLNGSIKAGMDLRRYELATLAAARQLRSSYCSLAHGKVLRDRFLDESTVGRVAVDHHDAGLADVDVSIMDFAAKVAADATSITAADVDGLRRHGLDDADIFQVVLAAAARCFFSTVIDAVGAEPDAEFRTRLSPELLDALTVGRPIAAA